MGDSEAGDQNEVGELLEFPCEFPLKVFGLNDETFESTVMGLVREHCAPDTQFKISRNESKHGKYQSLTITFTAQSRAQLDAIYQSLTDCDQVVMSL